jgi:protein SSD1
MGNYLSSGSGPFSAGLAYQNPLAGLPETDSDGINPYGVDFAYQQQLLAAQYQQIQLLQAQIQANQIAQQQAQQQQQSQSTPFSAPRFQALAAQRMLQQQEQQARLHQAHEQAQHMYQTQALQVLQQANEAQSNLEQSAANAPPVFEEDSPENKPVPLATSGRPGLNPNFTFGAKRQQEPARESMSPPNIAPLINRSEGIGGAAATGLAGLAARAHKRTGSEVTPAMQEQVCAISC